VLVVVHGPGGVLGHSVAPEITVAQNPMHQHPWLLELGVHTLCELVGPGPVGPNILAAYEILNY
jgi:hypothetical protein